MARKSGEVISCLRGSSLEGIRFGGPKVSPDCIRRGLVRGVPSDDFSVELHRRARRELSVGASWAARGAHIEHVLGGETGYFVTRSRIVFDPFIQIGACD